MLQVYCRNTGTSMDFQEGTTLQDVLSSFSFEQPYRIVSAKGNNVSQGLRFRIYNSKTVEFVDVRSSCGMHVYNRSLSFLLYKASSEVFPGSKLMYIIDVDKTDEEKADRNTIDKTKLSANLKRVLKRLVLRWQISQQTVLSQVVALLVFTMEE